MDQTTQRKDNFVGIKPHKERINLFGTNHTKKGEIYLDQPTQRKENIDLDQSIQTKENDLDQVTQTSQSKEMFGSNHTKKEEID